MVELKNGDVSILQWRDINELIDYSFINGDLDKNTELFGNNRWSLSNNRECSTQNRSEKLLKSGRGLSTIRKISQNYRDEFQNTDLNDLMNTVQSVKRTRKFNDFDGNLDFDRVMSGNMDYWERVERTGDYKVVRVGINYGMSNGNTIDNFSRLVGLGAIFCEILENIGYGVEIYGANIKQGGMGDDKKVNGHIFPVKAVNEPLDFERIYSLGIPALLRRFTFRTEYVLSGDYGGWSYMPKQDVLDVANIDVLLTRSWTDKNKQVDKIIQAIENLK